MGEAKGKGVKLIGDDAPKVLNRLAREQMKMKLLDDVQSVRELRNTLYWNNPDDRGAAT